MLSALSYGAEWALAIRFIWSFCKRGQYLLRSRSKLYGSRSIKQIRFLQSALRCYISFWIWLGWQDSNLRMAASKAAALPLGDTPI